MTADQLRIDTRARSILKVKRRAELSAAPDAAARLRSLRAEFQAWMAIT